MDSGYSSTLTVVDRGYGCINRYGLELELKLMEWWQGDGD